jgi:hypothetical protein
VEEEVGKKNKSRRDSTGKQLGWRHQITRVERASRKCKLFFFFAGRHAYYETSFPKF